MAIHTTLPIYKVTYELTLLTLDLCGRYPRNLKLLGTKMIDLCIDMVATVYVAIQFKRVERNTKEG